MGNLKDFREDMARQERDLAQVPANIRERVAISRGMPERRAELARREAESAQLPERVRISRGDV